MKLSQIPRCPDCERTHLGRCGNLSFRDRLLSVRISAEITPSRTRTLYNEDVVQDQFGGKTAKDRRAEYLDDTQGFGAGTTDSKGNVWANDPKTKEKRILSPKEVSQVYLGESGSSL